MEARPRRTLREQVAPPAGGWGVPDWTDSRAYPSASQTSWQQWAWEFLRRNTAYRKEWMRSIYPFLGPVPDRAGLNPPTFNFRAHEALVRANCAAPLDYFLRFGLGLDFPDDPRSATSLGFTQGGLRCATGEIANLELRETEAAIIFDFSLPIEPQITKAERMLDSLAGNAGLAQEPTARPRPRGEELRLKLRALDAYDAAASTDARLRVLARRQSEDAKWLDNLSRSAEELSRAKYLELVLWSAPDTVNPKYRRAAK